MERLFREGRRSSSYLLSALALPSPAGFEETGRLGFVAGKKLGVAPYRCRCKRVMRAVAAELGGPWPGMDVVFVARYKTGRADHAKLLKEMRKCLGGLGVTLDDQ